MRVSPERTLPLLFFILLASFNNKVNGFSSTVNPRIRATIPKNRPSTTSLNSVSPEVLTLAKSIAPKVGVVTSMALFLAPALSVWKAIRDNDIGDLNPIPVATLSLVSVSWLAYGLMTGDNYVTYSNIGGAIVSFGYIVAMLPLLGSKEAKSVLRTTQGVVLMGATAVLCLWTYLGVTQAPLTQSSTTLGLFASGLFIILSASPLSTIRKVVTHQNSASIMGSITATQVINTSLWSAYGLAVKDLFVWGPNIIGLGLGLVQLGLKVIFPSNRSKKAGDERENGLSAESMELNSEEESIQNRS